MRDEQMGQDTTKSPLATTYHDHDFDYMEFSRTAQPILACIPLMAQAEIDQYLGGKRCQKEAWEKFFKCHSEKASFFKKRRYLPLEFPELRDDDVTSPPKKLLELGCGYGSSLAAVLEANRTIRCMACDLSETALKLLHERLDPMHGDRLATFVGDAASLNDWPATLVPPSSMDFVLMVFMLSALATRESHLAVLRRAKSVCRPGDGLILFRDYALLDATCLRSRKRCGENLFARQDGTLAYFFSVEGLRALVEEVGGLRILECSYATVITKNRASQTSIYRVFLHAKIQRSE